MVAADDGQGVENVGGVCTGKTLEVELEGVEGKAKALSLGDGEGVAVARLGDLLDSAAFGVGIAKQQVIGDVLVVVAALLGQVVGPTEETEEWTDQLHLCSGFVDGVKAGGLFEKGQCLGAEGVEVCGMGEGFLPSVGVVDAFG